MVPSVLRLLSDVCVADLAYSPSACLRACYAMSDTDLAYAAIFYVMSSTALAYSATRCLIQRDMDPEPLFRYKTPLSAYGCARRCPVLTYRMLLSAYALRGE
eukprot:1292380-Rhodomonas_salina.1